MDYLPYSQLVRLALWEFCKTTTLTLTVETKFTRKWY
mgnify:CR=1 FL=1